MSTGCGSSLKRTFSNKSRKKYAERTPSGNIERRDQRGLETPDDIADIKSVLKDVERSSKRIKKQLPKTLYSKDTEVHKQEIEEEVRTLRRYIDSLHKLLNLHDHETEEEIRLKEEKSTLKRQLTLRKERVEELENKLKSTKEDLTTAEFKEDSFQVKLAEISNLKIKLDKFKEENDSLRSELSGRKEKISNLQKELNEERRRFIESQVSAENDLSDRHQLQANVTRLEKKLESEVMAKEKALTRLKEDSFQVKLAEISNLQIKLDKFKEENDSLRSELSERKEKISNLQKELNEEGRRFIESHVSAENDLSDRHQLQANVTKLEKKLESEVMAKEKALTRLSALTAIQLKDNNPNITDLSDPNRPMKLAEKLSELYDNEWTDAIENLENAGSVELDSIKILLKILTETYIVCEKLSTSQMSRIKDLLIYPPFQDKQFKHSKKKKRAPPPPNPFTGEIDSEPAYQDDSTHNDTAELNKNLIDELPSPQEIIKNIKDYRRTVATSIVPELQKVLIHQLDLNDMKEACGPYIDKCMELCWYMVVQDPPLSLSWELNHGDLFPSDKFKSYTKRGNKVDYVVWPTLYLFEGGSMLSKGVCQGLE